MAELPWKPVVYQAKTRLVLLQHTPMTKYDHPALMGTEQRAGRAPCTARFTGDRTVLDGPQRLLALRRGNGYAPDLRDGLGENWVSGQTQFKRYPANLYTQPAIELLRQMQAAGDFTADAVDAIEIKAARVGLLELKFEADAPHETWAS
jgi:2-methylcitrate dehydratase PrpD